MSNYSTSVVSPPRIAIKAIATKYPNHPQILPLLKNRAKKDPDENVRSEAIKEIANGWKNDPGIFNFLGNCALQDPFKEKDDSYPFPSNPRKTALEAIATKYPNHPQILPLLKNRAKKDPDVDVRKWAKNTLRQFQKWKASNTNINSDS